MNHRIVSTCLLLGGAIALAAALFLPASVSHPVTPTMLTSAREKSGSRLPDIQSVDSEGRNTSLTSMAVDRPLVLFFIQQDCPCSEAAEPFFHRLHTAYGTGAAFYGVIDGDGTAAREWARRHRSPYPVLADPDLRIIRACGAERSAYVAIIARGVAIDQLWPGYSSGMLAELEARLTQLTGLTVPPIDAAGAPIELASGCSF